MLVLALMAFDAARELTITHQSRWMGDVGVGEVNMVAMWLPVALLLVTSAAAVSRTSTVWRRSKGWLIGVPVAASLALRVFTPYWQRWTWDNFQSWVNPLGLIFIYVPLVLVPVTMLVGIVRKDVITKTVAAMLVVMSCLPVMWLLTMVAPEWVLVPSEYVSVLFYYYGPAIVVALAIVMLLLRRRHRERVRVD